MRLFITRTIIFLCLVLTIHADASSENGDLNSLWHKVSHMFTPAGPNKKIKDMNYEEARAAKDYYQQQYNDNSVVKCLERLVTLSADHTQTKEHLHELGERYLTLGRHKEAQETFEQCRLLFPGDNASYIRYQEIRSHYLDLKDPTRDQTETRTTIELTKEYGELFSHDKTYSVEVKDIQYQCYRQLIDSELFTMQQYLNKYNYSGRISSLRAAARRLRFIINDLLPEANLQTLTNLTINETPDPKDISDDILSEDANALKNRMEKIAYVIQNPENAPTTKKPHPRDKF